MTNILTHAGDLSPASRTASRSRWHLAYFLLATFNLVTVLGSLYVTHRLMNIYTQSVAVNQQWAERLRSYTDLGQLAGAVNAPGNDVFDSQDVAGETARKTKAAHAFGQAMQDVRLDVMRNVDSGEAGRFIRNLDAIDAAMAEMTSEADLIFSVRRQNRRDVKDERATW